MVVFFYKQLSFNSVLLVARRALSFLCKRSLGAEKVNCQVNVTQIPAHDWLARYTKLCNLLAQFPPIG